MRREPLALAAGLLLATQSLSGQQLDAGVTVQAARGRYIFEDATTSWMLLTTFSAQGDRWRFSASVPGIYQNSSAVSYVGGVPIGTGGPNGGTVAGRRSGDRIPGRRQSGGGAGTGLSSAFGTAPSGQVGALTTDSGYIEAPGAYQFTLGDPLLTLGRDLWTSAGGEHRLGMQGFAKLPLAPVSSGVGTGAADVGAALSASVTLGRTMLALDVSHWVIGNLPNLELRDITGAMFGIGHAFGWSRQHALTATVGVATAAVARSTAPQTATIVYGFLNEDGRSLNIGVAHGLTESSAEWTAWIGWQQPFGR